ncbi:cell surface glycoprotein 1-like [Macrobrachium rosenbergii]|uniref:cell surface glycoprotein 1-like n=1 Tax=Macrobrachium rosenbergii TaxID=79674 RepID=UPI0034D41343
MQGRYQGRVMVVEQPLPRYQRPIYMQRGERVVGLIWTLPIVINSGVFGVLLAIGGIIMIAVSERVDYVQGSSNEVVMEKKSAGLLAGGIICMIVGALFLILCISLTYYTKKRYKSVISSSHLRRHVIHCSPPYRDEDQLLSRDQSSAPTTAPEQMRGVTPMRCHRTTVCHSLDGQAMEYQNSQSVPPVSYTNTPPRAPLSYLRSAAVYPSRYPPSVGQRFNYNHSSNGQHQPFYYDFLTDELRSRRPPSVTGPMRTRSLLERPPHDLLSPREQQLRNHFPHSGISSDNHIFREQPLHILPEDQPISKPYYPPPVGKQFGYLQSSNGQRYYYDFSTDEVRTHRPHSNREEAHPQPSLGKLVSNDPTLDERTLQTLQEEEQPSAKPRSPDEQPGEEPLSNIPDSDEAHSSNTLSEGEPSLSTTLSNLEPLPISHTPSPEGDLLNNSLDPNAEPSDDFLALEEEPSNYNLDPQEEPSSSAPAPEDGTLSDMPTPEEELSSNAPDPEGEQSGTSPAPDEEPSSDIPGPEDEPSDNMPGPEEESSDNMPGPGEETSADPREELSGNSPTPDEDLSNNTLAPEEEPSSNSPAPEEEPSSNSPAPEEEPSSNSPAPEEEPSSDTPAPEEEPSSNTLVPEEEPSSNTHAPEEEPTSNTPAPEEEPSSTTPVPEEEPASNIPANEEEPSSKTPIPDEEPSDENLAPEEPKAEPSSDASAPEEEPSAKVSAPDEEPK